MKRYQVYLNPHSVSIIDEMEKYTDISRSALIRSTVDLLAQNLAKVLSVKTTVPKAYPYLDSLVGSINVSSGKKINFSERGDSVYYRD